MKEKCDFKIVKQYIKSDLFRYCEGKCSFVDFIKCYLKNPTFRYQLNLRLCKGKGVIKFIGLVLYKFNFNRNIVINWRTDIGYGLYIGHNGPIVINPTTKIGNNCNLSQFTSIGSNMGKAAVIGDNVYIGPNVCVVEDVIIGDNVTIGAGSVVTKDIPSNATAVGNYAKVINYNNPGRFINNQWKIFED